MTPSNSRDVQNAANRRPYRKHRDERLAYGHTHKEQTNSAARKRNWAIKEEAIQHYGGECACCHETALEFLAIDHVKGNGNKHRKEIGLDGGVGFYKWLKRNNWPEGFRAMCHNCNMAIGI